MNRDAALNACVKKPGWVLYLCGGADEDTLIYYGLMPQKKVKGKRVSQADALLDSSSFSEHSSDGSWNSDDYSSISEYSSNCPGTEYETIGTHSRHGYVDEVGKTLTNIRTTKGMQGHQGFGSGHPSTGGQTDDSAAETTGHTHAEKEKEWNSTKVTGFTFSCLKSGGSMQSGSKSMDVARTADPAPAKDTGAAADLQLQQFSSLLVNRDMEQFSTPPPVSHSPDETFRVVLYTWWPECSGRC